MATRRVPYATNDEKPVIKPSAAVKPVSTPPWEKDQSSKPASEARKRSNPAKPPPQSAPYGTLHNQPVLRVSSVQTSTSKSAPYGTAQNVPAFRDVKSDGLHSAPYGTSADVLKPSKTNNVRSLAPWERNDARPPHKVKTNANFGLSAPYATEPIK